MMVCYAINIDVTLQSKK